MIYCIKWLLSFDHLKWVDHGHLLRLQWIPNAEKSTSSRGASDWKNQIRAKAATWVIFLSKWVILQVNQPFFISFAKKMDHPNFLVNSKKSKGICERVLPVPSTTRLGSSKSPRFDTLDAFDKMGVIQSGHSKLNTWSMFTWKTEKVALHPRKLTWHLKRDHF